VSAADCTGRSGLLVDFTDLLLVRLHALLRFFERLREGADLLVDLAHGVTHELLRGARRRDAEGYREHTNHEQ